MTADSPWRTLGLPPGSEPASIRARYTALVKRYPPDRDAARFERIRDAYRRLQDPRALAAERLFGPPPLDSLDELVEALRPQRRSVGAGLWLEALKEIRS